MITTHNVGYVRTRFGPVLDRLATVSDGTASKWELSCAWATWKTRHTPSVTDNKLSILTTHLLILSTLPLSHTITMPACSWSTDLGLGSPNRLSACFRLPFPRWCVLPPWPFVLVVIACENVVDFIGSEQCHTRRWRPADAKVHDDLPFIQCGHPPPQGWILLVQGTSDHFQIGAHFWSDHVRLAILLQLERARFGPECLHRRHFFFSISNSNRRSCQIGLPHPIFPNNTGKARKRQSNVFAHQKSAQRTCTQVKCRTDSLLEKPSAKQENRSRELELESKICSRTSIVGRFKLTPFFFVP